MKSCFFGRNNRWMYILKFIATASLITVTLLCYTSFMKSEASDASVQIPVGRSLQSDAAAMSDHRNEPVGASATKGMVDEADDKLFKIHIVTDSFKLCQEQIILDQYLRAYKELYRFFQLMGSVFSFVASDVIDKVRILEDLRKSENGHHYSTIESMILYEKENQLLNKKGFVSGSRTLLRLHRALEFIHSFMLKLSKVEDSHHTSHLARESYQNTLAKFHPWLIQKGGLVAMYTLPTKDQLLSRVCSARCKAENPDYNDQMKLMAESTIHVYNMTQKLYEHHNLLDLP